MTESRIFGKWPTASRLPIHRVTDADPLGQGISNLEAYFYGLNPWQPDSSYPIINGGQSVTSNSVIAIDASSSPLPFLEANLSSNMASPLILSNNLGGLTVSPPSDGATNFTVYLQYETAQTNALGHQFTETVTMDTQPPTLTLDPSNGQTLDRSYPLMIVSYTDTVAGVDISTLSVHIDATNDVTSSFCTQVYEQCHRKWQQSDCRISLRIRYQHIADLAGNARRRLPSPSPATGTINAGAPGASSFNIVDHMVIPSVNELWLQGIPSATDATVYASVNGGGVNAFGHQRRHFWGGFFHLMGSAIWL